DRWGVVLPVGASPVLATSASWPTKDIAFSLALFPDGTGGYVMDGWGRLHPIGVAPAIDSGVYWPHWIGAREIVMAPWASAYEPAGYLLDADGGIHAFGGAPVVVGNVTWPGKGIARALVLSAGSTRAAVMGYTLDGFGGIHPFGGAHEVFGSTQWSADVARGIVLTTSRNGLFVQGYTLDYSGGVHPFGGAPVGVGPAAHPVWEIGCLLSDLAMVYSHFGARAVTPATIASHLGWFNARGAIYNSALNIPGHTMVVNHNPSAAWIAAQVASG